MSRFRFCTLTVLSLVLAGSLPPSGFSAENSSTPKVSDKEGVTCVVYSLGDLGDDPSFGKWVADTIPEVVQPGSWSKGVPLTGWTTEGTSKGEGKYILSYYAPAKILVVSHTPAVQAKVEEFLKNVKKAMPLEKSTAKPAKLSRTEAVVVPAKYTVPDSVKPVPAGNAPRTLGYPVPAQTRQPKHLFHFIIRYEGEGLVDDSVAGVIKDVYGAQKAKEEAESKPAKGASTTSAQPEEADKP